MCVCAATVPTRWQEVVGVAAEVVEVVVQAGQVIRVSDVVVVINEFSVVNLCVCVLCQW